MHEMSIAQSLVDIIRQEMVKHDAKVLHSVRLKIGQLSAVVPDSLSFCFEVITSGTEMEGANLLMDVTPLMGQCKRCEASFEIENYAFECPACGSKEINTVSGEELAIVEMEVD